jgi:hypothetical protein
MLMPRVLVIEDDGLLPDSKGKDLDLWLAEHVEGGARQSGWKPEE